MESHKEENKKLITKFLSNCEANNISSKRIDKYTYQLNWISEKLSKHFGKAEKEDIEKVVIAILQNKEWSEWTKYDYQVAVKKFYRWMNDGETCSKVASWIKPRIKMNNSKMPEDMLSEDDIKKMIQFAPSSRDKAYVMTLYESGCRNGEMLSIQLKHITFDKQGVHLRVHGKTGSRNVFLILSSPYLRDWIDNHPQSDNPEAPLFIMSDGKPLTQAGSSALLIRISERANIKRKVNPHNFRHSRATYLANKLTEAQMKQYLGWTQSSRMESVYVHLSGRDTDNAILEMNGLKKESQKQEEKKLKPKVCSRCDEVNKTTSTFCHKCGAILDLKTSIDFEKQQDEEKDILHMFVKKIVEKNPELASETLEKLPKDLLEKLKNL